LDPFEGGGCRFYRFFRDIAVFTLNGMIRFDYPAWQVFILIDYILVVCQNPFTSRASDTFGQAFYADSIFTAHTLYSPVPAMSQTKDWLIHW